MARAMTPFQAVLRRVVKHSPGRKSPTTSVYCIAVFKEDHPIGETHYDDIIKAIGAHWARLLSRKRKQVEIGLIFKMTPEEFDKQMTEALGLSSTGLSRTVLTVALQVARAASCKAHMAAKRSGGKTRKKVAH